ncbi:MAG TPA: hypothetical protein DCX73_00870, partial [Eubacterium sp.]|nr:hypothetical protein [Eubacterium sp.]
TARMNACGDSRLRGLRSRKPIGFRQWVVHHSSDEDRYIAIGRVGDILFVVFTERGENICIISARLATEAERRLYYDKEISSY